ncbi:MAG TPA: nucleoside kinase [Candidatus Scatovivens faecipullorum]|nr:nucleoside kinase [Candidatus Scatovivens faecipullorum]
MKITYDNREFDIEENTTIGEAFKKEIENSKLKDIIAARFNNTIESLNLPIKKDGEIEFINREDKDGRIIYIRGLLFIMSMAFSEVYPKALLTVNYQLSNAMFSSVDNMEVTDEMIKKVKQRMQEIIDEDIPIRKIMMTQKEAEEFYKKEETIKGRLQTDIDKEKVSLYFCKDYYNYFYGTMPISTGFAKIYDFVKYRDGFLVKYPSLAEPDVLQPNVDTLKLVSAMDEYDEINRLMKINTVHRLNKKLKEEKGVKELILLSEALHEKKIAEIANKIKEHGNVRMVLIAGPSSSGKTTFAGKLGMSLKVNGIKPVTISVDNYFVERKDNPKDEKGNYDFECIEALDLDLFNSQLVDLLKGKEVKLPTFNFTTGSKEYRGNTLKLKEDEILVIEGIHCLNDKLTNLIPKENKFKVYISDLTVLNIDYYNRISTTDTRLIRRIVRDYKFRNYSAEHTLKTWYSVNRGEQKNIFPYQEEADCMFNSSIVYELAVLKKYAMPLLEEIPETSREYSEARRLITLLKYFKDMEPDLIPNNSLLREFIGGSIFEY